MRRISVLAVLVGGAVSFFTSMILSIPLGVIMAFKVDAIHQRASVDAIRSLPFAEPALYWGGFAIGIASCILGGFFAGVTAKHDQALNGLISSLVIVLTTVSFQGMDPHPLSVRLVQLAGYAAASWLGGYLRGAQARRKAQRPSAAMLQSH